MSKTEKVAQMMWVLQEHNFTEADIAEFVRIVGSENEDSLRLEPIHSRIRKILLDLGAHQNVKGYGYIEEAIEIAYYEPTVMITKEIYPKVAREFKTSYSRVERNLRTIIEYIWENGNWSVIMEIFGHRDNITTKRPSNGEFILSVANYLRLQDESETK